MACVTFPTNLLPATSVENTQRKEYGVHIVVIQTFRSDHIVRLADPILKKDSLIRHTAYICYCIKINFKC